MVLRGLASSTQLAFAEWSRHRSSLIPGPTYRAVNQVANNDPNDSLGISVAMSPDTLGSQLSYQVDSRADIVIN